MVAQLAFGGDDQGGDGSDDYQNDDGDDLYDAREYDNVEEDEAPSRFAPCISFGQLPSELNPLSCIIQQQVQEVQAETGRR